MSFTRIAAATVVALASFVVATGHAAQGAPNTPNEPNELRWGPAPAVFPPGAQMAVLAGDPSKAEPFTVRLRFPDGYRIMPHTHPTDEHVTVISGTFRVGMGEHFRSEGMLTLPRGGFVTAPAGHAHYAAARGTTVVQVHATGPFSLTYVHPTDLPVAARGGGR